MTATEYRVTKLHTRGVLKGMTTTETTSVCFPVGFVVERSISGGGYVVTECREIAPC